MESDVEHGLDRGTGLAWNATKNLPARVGDSEIRMSKPPDICIYQEPESSRLRDQVLASVSADGNKGAMGRAA